MHLQGRMWARNEGTRGRGKMSREPFKDQQVSGMAIL
jgi:hypothetical protein